MGTCYIWLYIAVYGYICLYIAIYEQKHPKNCIWSVWPCIFDVRTCIWVSRLVFRVSGLLFGSGFVFGVVDDAAPFVVSPQCSNRQQQVPPCRRRPTLGQWQQINDVDILGWPNMESVFPEAW